MDETKWADPFNQDVDALLAQGSPQPPANAPEEYRQMLAAAGRLGRADYSRDSRIALSLRARLVEKSQTTAQRPARRLRLPVLAGYAALVIFVVVCALGLSRVFETFVPGAGPTGQPPAQATSGPAVVLEDYLGAPRPMVLEIGGQSQTAALGSYCWINGKQGAVFTRACAEVSGLPTPRQALRIGSPVSARLRSPFPSTPTSLSLLILSIGADALPAAQTADTLTWKLATGQVQTLPLQPEPQFQVTLPDGLYAFSLQAAWQDMGTVTYGFLVQVDHAIPTPTVRVEPAVEPTLPPAPPAPTEAGLATSTPAEAEGFYATQQAARETAIAARATASPFPTGAPARVQPGRPASVQVQRDGLSLQVSLVTDSFVAGEGGLAQVTVRNDGKEPLFIDGNGRDLAGFTLLDEQGHTPDPWPYSWFWMMSGPPYLQKLEPGQQLAAALQFQIPPAGQDTPDTYYLWAETRFSRPDPQQPEGPDNVWLRLQGGPLALKIAPPKASNHLQIDFKADAAGWQIHVIPAAGSTLPTELWGQIGATSNGATTAGPLHLAADGSASGAWSDGLFERDAQLRAGGWVAAQGFVTQPFTMNVPGRPGDFPLPDLAVSIPPRQDFATLAAAQAGIAVPIAHPSSMPPGAVPGGIRATWNGTDQMTIEQRYRLENGGWLTLTQYVYNPSDTYGGWGQARYDSEAQAVKVNGNEGYAAIQDGWLRLDWRAGPYGYELSTPQGAFTLDELVQLASSIK